MRVLLVYGGLIMPRVRLSPDPEGFVGPALGALFPCGFITGPFAIEKPS
jgi:hypothetical protein